MKKKVVKKRKERAPRLHPEVVKEIKEMLEDHLTERNIAKYLGVELYRVKYLKYMKTRKAYDARVYAAGGNRTPKKAKNR